MSSDIKPIFAWEIISILWKYGFDSPGKGGASGTHSYPWNKQKRYSTSHSSLEFQTWVGNATHIKLKLVVFDISIDEIKNNCNRFLILLALKILMKL